MIRTIVDKKFFPKENIEHLKVLCTWCEAHDVSFSGKETAVILAMVHEILRAYGINN